MKSDKDIISGILSGNKDSYREIVSRYQQNVYSVALKMTNNQKDAEDITQEVFIQAYKSLSSFSFNASLSTWLYRITLNKALDWKRKQKNLISFDTILENKKIEDDNEDSWLQGMEQKNMVACVEQLPEVYQDVIKLYYFKDMSYQQIAETEGIAKKTVESRLYRAKAMLKEIWLKEGFR